LFGIQRADVAQRRLDVGVAQALIDSDRVFVLELKAGGRVIRLAHTHSRVTPEQEHEYWAGPCATTNRDLTGILFTANWWRSGSEQVDVCLTEPGTIWP
jgi:hypothetical protein